MLMNYPDWICLRVADPMQGLPGIFEHCPRISEIKKACDGWLDEHNMREKRRERFTPKLPAPGEWTPPPQPTVAAASVAALCARFGITHIPPGWDAIDLTRAAHRFGAGLQAEIDRIAASGRRAETMPARILATARQAMEQRIAEGRPISSDDEPFFAPIDYGEGDFIDADEVEA